MLFHIHNDIPWWGYLLILVLFFVGIYLIHNFSKKLKNIRNYGMTETSDDPITIQKTMSPIIPGNAQHIGARTEQQDAFGFSDIADEAFISKYGVLAVLADGMGGLQGGKEASYLAVQTFLDQYLNSSEIDSIPEKLEAALIRANETVLQFARENKLEGKVGTTLIASVIFMNQLYWLSVGDSRIYLKNGETLTQLTKDHIYANELDEKASTGEITLEEALNDPQRESLTSFLGLETVDEMDITTNPIRLHKGDSVILCSDGLYGTITNQEILDALHTLSTQLAAEKLIEIVRSKQKPNQDNATVALLTIE
ncbi:PP2C family protein-serine/threonine phosphatase [Ferdinandcohnia quinoae]|uniref:Protein phosphatase 2C domain-containing protein n=1 Tax=Fredinandcohnia quinoae TaxID=2918902 RepID=A0AAW5DYH2_9BACI|nr:protein phosphatase 2C domain-containing protein [Fredinandcohnia sp. SECRCQ15]MCH1625696.1 protein phosphatase 2C domain-containing protein [Fredinandcohnia sp. SECRCQ15]